MTSNLKTRTIKAVSWNLLGRIIVLGENFIIGIIIARLLTPEDYGLVGMIAIFTALSEVLVRSGFGEAFVQKKEVTQADAATMFISNILISLFLYIVLWFAAPLIAKFYNQPVLIALTRVMSITLLIQAFTIVQATNIRRNLNFKIKTKITSVSIFISGITGIIAAISGLGVWSLVIKSLTNSFLVSIGFWLSSNWRPSLAFSKSAFKEMFSFGFWVLLTNLLKRFFENLNKLIIGKIFSAAQLGLYSKAKDLQTTASIQIIQSISSVSFPVLSKLQDDDKRLQQAAKVFLKNTTAIILPIMITTIIIAKPFIILTLTEKWSTMIPFLQLLCIVGILYIYEDINLKIILAKGKSRYNFWLMLIKNILTILNLTIMYRFGIVYIIIGEIILSFISMIISSLFTQNIINYGFLKQMKDTMPILLLGVAAGVSAFLVTLLTSNLWIHFFVGSLFSIGLYALFQYLFNPTFFSEVYTMGEALIKKNRVI